MTTDIAELVTRYRSEGHEQVQSANRGVATTGREAEQATDRLTEAERRKTVVDKTSAAGAKEVAQETRGVTRAMQETERGVRSTTRAMQGLDTRMDATGMAARRLGADAANANRAMSSFDVRGVAMQLSQVAQQASATGDPLRAMAIQLPDIGLAFGTIGIAAGVAAGALLPLAAGFFDAGADAEEAADAVEDFASALEVYDGYAQIAMTSTIELRERFGEFADEVRAHAQFMSQIAASEAMKGLAETSLVGGIEGALTAAKSLEMQREFIQNMREQGVATTEQIRNAEETLGIFEDRARNTAEEIGLTVDQVRELAPMIRALKEADTMEGVAEVAGDIVDEIRSIYDGATAIPTPVAEFLQRMVDVEKSAAQASETMKDVSRSAQDTAQSDIDHVIGNAAQYADEFADAMARAWESASGITGLDFSALGGMGRALGDFYNTTLSQAEAADRGILDLIAMSEGTAAGSNLHAQEYNTTLDYGRWTGGPRDLVNMSLDEILALGDSMRTPENRATYAGGGSSALGRYQIVGTTLRDLMRELNLSGDELYSPEMQDRLAMQLVRRRMGQGPEGFRQEWQGLNNVPDAVINRGLGAQSVPTVDPTTEAESTRAMNEALREAEKARKDAARATEEETRANEQSQRAYDQLLGSLDPVIAAQQEYEAAQEAVNEALARGQITQAEATQTLAQAREQMQETLAGIEEELRKEQFEEIEQRIGSISDAMANAIVNGESMGEALAGVFRQIAADILSAGIQQALMSAFAPAAGGAGGGFFGNILGSIFGGGSAKAPSFDGGGYTGSGSRTGGVDGKGGFWSVMHPNETVIDHTKSDMGGSSINIAPQFNISGGDDRENAVLREQLNKLTNEFEGRVIQTVRAARTQRAL